MRELIYDNVRIQFLSEEVLRLEVRYGAYFTDRNTLWIPDRGAFEKAGKRLPESQSRSRENIYTPQQQKHWLDQPEGKSGSINNVKKLQKIIKGYAAALEEKEKERAWLMEQ